jgi:hypothetical protein
MSSESSDKPVEEREQPKTNFIETWKWWIIGVCAVFLVGAILWNRQTVDSSFLDKKEEKTEVQSPSGRPTRDNPIHVDLNSEWTLVTYYSQISGNWKIQWGKTEIELTTNPNKPSESWKPSEVSKNLDAGEPIYGRTVENGGKKTIAFFYE